MFSILLFKKNEDSIFATHLLENFSKFYCMLYVNKKFSYEKGNGYPIAVLDSNCSSLFSLKDSIMIFDENVMPDISIISCETKVAIVHSSDSKLIKCLNNKNIRVITCGSNPCDDFSFSSRTDDEIVVTLQKPIKTIYSTTVEPFEYPFKNVNPIENYSNLAFIAVKTLYNDFENYYL